MTIVTPSYNQGQYIEETIRSVLLQGYPDLEYIIIDGGSSDGTIGIIQKYARWLSYWVSEPDKGQSDAINKGFARSTGEILAWLNSDDTYLPSALTQAALAFQTYSEAAVVHGKSQACDEKGVPLYHLGRHFNMKLMLTEANQIAQPSAFIRRRYAERAGPLNITYHYSMDLDYWLRLSLLGDLSFVDELWSIFRCHSNSKTKIWPIETDFEHASIYRTFFERQDLPEHIARLKPASFMRTNLVLAKRFYARDRLPEARHHIRLALGANWRALFIREWYGCMIRVLLGPRLVSGLKNLVSYNRAVNITEKPTSPENNDKR